MAIKIHLAVTYAARAAHGGVLNTTLCGRMNRATPDGMNSTGNREEVTCWYCSEILAKPNNWRHRKYLKGERA